MKNYQVNVDFESSSLETPHLPGTNLLPYEDILHIGEETTKSLLDKDGESSWNAEVIRASAAERETWREKYEVFQQRVDVIGKAIDAAHRALEQEVKSLRAQAEEAWRDYEPVHKALCDRTEEVNELREKHEEAKQKSRDKAAARFQAAQDAALGPRHFLVTRPSQRGQGSAVMDVPTIHYIDCPVAKRLSRLPDPVRITEAFTALMDGGVQATKRFYSYEPDHHKDIRIPGVACERCPAFLLLKDHAPETFMAWLERTESQQFPALPSQTYKGREALMKKLGLEQYTNYPSFAEGWTEVSSGFYKEANDLTDHEFLIGWYGRYPRDESRAGVLSGQQGRLKELFKELPPRGFSVRWIHEPQSSGGDVCTSAVAVRFLSKWEMRKMKEMM